MAIAEKVSALKTQAYFETRRKRGKKSAFNAWLSHSPDAPPMVGDHLE